MKEYTDEYVFTKMLKDLVNSKELCAVYSDPNKTTKFSVGYILGIDNEFYLMSRIDPNGMQDGIDCSRIELIFKVEKNNAYCKSLSELINHHKQKPLPKIICGSDVKLSLIEYAQKHNKVCEFELCESDNKDMIGFINNYKDGMVSVQEISEDGVEDGESYAPFDAIDVIVCGSSNENRIEILHKLKRSPSKS